MPPQDPRQQQQQPNFPTPVGPVPRAPGQQLESTPYDFIMNPNNPTPPKPGLKGGGSKLLFIAGGGILLVVILFVVLSLSQGSSSSPLLVNVAQQQAEISRVADLHYDDLNDASTKGFVINTKLSIASGSQTYLGYLASNGVAVGEDKLALGINAETDTALDAAQANGTLDSTMRTTLQAQLERYQATLQNAYQQSSNPNTQVVLKDLFDQTSLLLEQSKR